MMQEEITAALATLCFAVIFATLIMNLIGRIRAERKRRKRFDIFKGKDYGKKIHKQGD